MGWTHGQNETRNIAEKGEKVREAKIGLSEERHEEDIASRTMGEIGKRQRRMGKIIDVRRYDK